MTKAERAGTSHTPPGQAPAPSSAGQSPLWPASGPEAGEQIRMRAYELYRERGGRVGDPVADWLQAEHEYRERIPKPGADPTGQGGSPSAPETRI